MSAQYYCVAGLQFGIQGYLRFFLISISFISEFLPCSPLIPIRSSPLPPRPAEAESALCAFRLGEPGRRRRLR
ncbi:hypothetical protein C7S17_1489 [Burkholderia thailandensis]|nr:hypothetical protein [Burkholderia thailandensis]